MLSPHWLATTYGPYLETYGMPADDLENEYVIWLESQYTAGVGDFLWHLFQQIILMIPKVASSEKDLYERNQTVYGKMWEYLVIHEQRNGTHVLNLKFLNQLRAWKLEESESTFQQEVSIISGHCCDYCNSFNQRTLSIPEALDQQPLASKQCTREFGGCNCTYAVIAKRDSKGRLIRR